MKKKIFAIVAAVSMMIMSSVTVFAAPNGNYDGNYGCYRGGCGCWR